MAPVFRGDATHQTHHAASRWPTKNCQIQRKSIAEQSNPYSSNRWTGMELRLADNQTKLLAAQGDS